MFSYRTARYPRTHISMNHLNGVASIFPPMIITISSVSLMSGSQPRLPPGELSNMNPKSDKGKWDFTEPDRLKMTLQQRWPPHQVRVRGRVRSCCTDVDEVTLAVQHDVAIVSVFDLQQKEQKAVGSHAADEVISSLQIGHFFNNHLYGPGQGFR